MQRFWLAEIDVHQLAILRILIGGFTIYYLANLLPLLEFHFSPAGWLGETQATGYFNTGNWSFLFWLHSPVLTNLFFILTIITTISFTAGYHTKVSGIITYIGLVSMWNRNPFILDGDDALLRVVIFYLMFSGCGHAFSIDAYRKTLPVFVKIWPLRLIQLQMALLYFVSGWVKFHSPDWSNGVIFNLVLVHPEYSRWNLNSFLEFSWIQQSLYYLAELIRYWEILFPVLLLISLTRKLSIITGILFHLGLLVFMNLRGFSLIMLTLYLAFLPNQYFSERKPLQLLIDWRDKYLLRPLQ